MSSMYISRPQWKEEAQGLKTISQSLRTAQMVASHYRAIQGDWQWPLKNIRAFPSVHNPLWLRQSLSIFRPVNHKGVMPHNLTQQIVVHDESLCAWLVLKILFSSTKLTFVLMCLLVCFLCVWCFIYVSFESILGSCVFTLSFRCYRTHS